MYNLYNVYVYRLVSNGNRYRLTHCYGQHLTTKKSQISLSIFQKPCVARGKELLLSFPCTVQYVHPDTIALLVQKYEHNSTKVTELYIENLAMSTMHGCICTLMLYMK